MPAQQPPWLTAEERTVWMSLAALMNILPAAVEADLQRDSGLTLFEYTVLAMLSERPDRTLQMSNLALVSNGSPSRLSHAAKRLESKGYIQRRPMAADGRNTEAVLTDAGWDKIVESAPRHVASVRAAVFDALGPRDLSRLRDGLTKIIGNLDPAAATFIRSAGRQGSDDRLGEFVGDHPTVGG